MPWYKLYLGCISNGYIKNEMSEISLNCIVYNFSVDHNAIEKGNILNNHEYLMKKISFPIY